jgi:hypothetical protein
MGGRLALVAAGGIGGKLAAAASFHAAQVAVPDMPVYDEALSERHWAALGALYAAQLA